MKLEKFLRNKFFTPRRKLSVYCDGYSIYRGPQKGTKSNKILDYFKDYEVVKVDGRIREFVIFIRNY